MKDATNPSIDYLLWDWNGTLLDDVEHCLCVVNEMLVSEGRPTLSKGDYRAHFDFPVIDYYRKVGFPTEPAEFARLSKLFIRGFNAGVGGCRLHAQAVECLRGWHAKGGRQAMLSASRQDHLEELVGRFGLAEYFDALGGIGDIYAASKVARGRQMLAQLGWNPAATLLIGDTRHDFEVADALGVHCLLVATGHQSAARLRQTGAEVVEMLRLDHLLQTRFGSVFAAVGRAAAGQEEEKPRR